MTTNGLLAKVRMVWRAKLAGIRMKTAVEVRLTAASLSLGKIDLDAQPPQETAVATPTSGNNHGRPPGDHQ